MPLIEAVPNISEGKNTAVLQTLAAYWRTCRAVQLLHIDSNPSANRTVYTLVAEPAALLEALFGFIDKTTQLLDMRMQHGTHPRIGAVDVCPLIPIKDISLKQTAQLARQLAHRVGQELQIPVYLYEAAARQEERKNLAFIRSGQYENLPKKLRTLPPDFGPQEINAHVQKTGACIIGARNFLIAFNINLNTRDVQAAQKIAARIRESNGGLPGVKAIGWYMENFKRAQVSCNIVDFRQTPLHLVYQTCQRYATQMGLQATGCELVGLVPLEAMLDSGHYYTPQEKEIQTLLNVAAQKLNLSEVKPFDPFQQIFEIKAGLVTLEK
ncbi:MAG: glutamate formimidoyltransferase [Elusimicrobiaceae bacterium]|nr:glutamate formimidoyltransferase [Elusimicrobiaceae bacterium]